MPSARENACKCSCNSHNPTIPHSLITEHIASFNCTDPLLCSTIESKSVHSSRRNASDLSLLAELNDAGAQIGGRDALVAKEVGSKTDNVGSSHGGARDGVRLSVIPSTENGDAWAPDVDEGTVVGE